MPCFSTQLSGGGQFLIGVHIFDAMSDHQSDGRQLDLKNQKLYTALIDTGAVGTCIADEVAKELNLIPTCKKQMKTAGDPVVCDEYDIHIAIPVTEITSYRHVADSSGATRYVPSEGVTHVKAWKSSVLGLPQQVENRGYDCLLGMDVLAACSFQYANGNLTICF